MTTGDSGAAGSVAAQCRWQVFDDAATQRLWEEFPPATLTAEIVRPEFLERLLDPGRVADAERILRGIRAEWVGTAAWLATGRDAAAFAGHTRDLSVALAALPAGRSLREVHASNWDELEREHALDAMLIDACTYVGLRYREEELGGLVAALAIRHEFPPKFAHDSVALAAVPEFREALAGVERDTPDGSDSFEELTGLSGQAAETAWQLVSALKACHEFASRHGLAFLPRVEGDFEVPAASDVKFDVRKNDRRYRTEQEAAAPAPSSGGGAKRPWWRLFGS